VHEDILRDGLVARFRAVRRVNGRGSQLRRESSAHQARCHHGAVITLIEHVSCLVNDARDLFGETK
jgi:hypothetical protein